MKIVNKFIFLFLTSVLLLQTVCFDILPKISAIEASLMPSIISFQLCIIILDNSLNEKCKRFLTLPIWNEIKKVSRVSYVFHPLNFKFISLCIPMNSDVSIELFIKMYIYIVINLWICKILLVKIEKNIIYFSKIISFHFNI